MLGKNLKITAKLTISAAAFLLPLGIMLYIIISTSLAGIQKGKTELKGIETLRPAISILQVLPLYVRFAADDVEGNVEAIEQYVKDFHNDFLSLYEKNFGTEEDHMSTQSLTENLNHIINTRIRDTVLWAYRQYIQDLCKTITYIGDICGLVTDSDLESSYLVLAAIHELPQVQERIVTIENLIRLIKDGAFTQRRREELVREHTLLSFADNSRIQNRVHNALNLRSLNSETSRLFENLLKNCYDRIVVFSNNVTLVINNPVYDEHLLSELSEAAGQTNNAAYRLQDASLERLQTIISSRISAYYRRLILSLAAAFASTALAFFIISVTTLGIRSSTSNMATVFRRLNQNDLSVNVQSASQDELGEFMKALRGFLDKLKIAFASFHKTAVMVSDTVNDLSASALEISTTANQQSSSVAEIVSTMENNKDLAEEAALKTEEVAALASRTQELSLRGADLRDANETMMLDIRNQNTKITEIIKNLADILSRIDESVQLIDTIADQTKLIAFNAALEAASSGEAGTRFSVVASEIRRYADNVVESTSEIKEKIFDLQNASHALITEADNGSRAIAAGYNRMVEQKEVFENIVDVSVHVASRTQQISNLSKQQEMASAHVFSALKEISSGVNQFVSSTAMTSAAVEKLNKMSIELKETLAKYQTKKPEEV
jgi:methyl-accepting chemotaxis protein